MAKWMVPTEALPTVYVGDRIIGIVRDRETPQAQLKPRIVILTATENGWSEESGYTIHDCELWTLESDLVRIADLI